MTYEKQEILSNILIDVLRNSIIKDMPGLNCTTELWGAENEDKNLIPFIVIININDKYLHLEYYIHRKYITTDKPFINNIGDEGLSVNDMVLEIIGEFMDSMPWFFL